MTGACPLPPGSQPLLLKAADVSTRSAPTPEKHRFAFFSIHSFMYEPASLDREVVSYTYL